MDLSKSSRNNTSITILNGSRKMYWDGTNRVIQSSSTGDCPLKGLGAFSINLWSRKPVGTTSHVLMGHDGGGSYWRYTGTTNLITHMALSTENSTGSATSSQGLVDDGKLKMYTMTYDGTTGKFFIDGNLIKSDAGEGTLSTGYENIGNYAGVTYTDGGYSDEISKWGTALTQAEIIELYNDGVFKDAKEHSQKNNLLAYYKNNVFVSQDGTSEWWKDLAPTDNLFFDGSNDYANFGSSSTLDDLWLGGATVSFWVYLDPDGSSSSNGGLIHKSGNGNFGWAIYLDSFTSGKYKFRFSQRWDNEDLIQEAHEVYPGIWNHIVVTYNANSKDNRATFYLDARVRTFDVLSSSYDASDSTAITTDAAQDLEVGRKY